MKIAFCLPDQAWIDAIRNGNPRDAAHIQQKHIAEGLRRRGHSLLLLAPSSLEQIVYGHNTDALETAFRTWTASRWFNLLSKVIWKLQQIVGIPYLNVFSNYRRQDACEQILSGIDIVYERNSLYNVGVARACKKLGLPYIVFFDADQIAELEFMGRPLTGWLLWRARNLLRENLDIAQRIICVSQTARDQLMANWNVPAEKIVVIPNAVDIQRFRPDPKLHAATRASLHLSGNPLLIFVGNFHQWHDVRTLLDAFATVLKSNPETRLVLLGDGAERGNMMKHASDKGIASYVQFKGFVTHDDVPQYVNAADIAVVPVPVMKQTMWLSPMKLFEYMSSGKAVVATAVGQIVDVIQDGRNGLLVPPGQILAMSDALRKLINDSDLRAALGQQARADAVQHYSWESHLSCLERVFETMINQSADAL